MLIHFQPWKQQFGKKKEKKAHHKVHLLVSKAFSYISCPSSMDRFTQTYCHSTKWNLWWEYFVRTLFCGLWNPFIGEKNANKINLNSTKKGKLSQNTLTSTCREETDSLLLSELKHSSVHAHDLLSCSPRMRPKMQNTWIFQIRERSAGLFPLMWLVLL